MSENHDTFNGNYNTINPDQLEHMKVYFREPEGIYISCSCDHDVSNIRYKNKLMF